MLVLISPLYRGDIFCVIRWCFCCFRCEYGLRLIGLLFCCFCYLGRLLKKDYLISRLLWGCPPFTSVVKPPVGLDRNGSGAAILSVGCLYRKALGRWILRLTALLGLSSSSCKGSINAACSARQGARSRRKPARVLQWVPVSGHQVAVGVCQSGFQLTGKASLAADVPARVVELECGTQ